jgi:hypothetical protein
VRLGIAPDETFGPVIVVGRGGLIGQLLPDQAVALPPLNLNLARHCTSDSLFRPDFLRSNARAMGAAIRKRQLRLPRSRRRVDDLGSAERGENGLGERIAHTLNLGLRSIQLRQPAHRRHRARGRRAAQGPARPALSPRSIDRGCDCS